MPTAPRWRPLALVVLAQLACAQPLPPPKTGPAAPSGPPPVDTESDMIAPPAPPAPTPPARAVDHPEVRPLKIVGRNLDRGFETLIADPGLPCREQERWEIRLETDAAHARGAQPWSGASYDGMLVLRRPAREASQLVHVYVPRGGCDETAPQTFTFALSDHIAGASDPAVLARWAEALASHARPAAEWGAFAQARLNELYVEPQREAERARAAKEREAKAALEKHDARAKRVKPEQKKPPAPKNAARGTRAGNRGVTRASVSTPGRQSQELARLMDTTTGVTSLQETLQGDRRLLTLDGESASVPLAELKGPPIPTHPWAAMTAALARPVPEEPLATAAPADFAFVRFRSLEAMFALFDRVERVLRPAAGWMEDDGRRAALAERYEAALGIGRGPLARRFGPEAITDVAVVGSDPYLREGSDVTLVFRVKAPVLFEAGLAAALSAHVAAHGALSTSAAEHAGVAIRVTTSADGAVRQHRARVGGFELVSNSLAALGRVIDAAAGKAPCLGDEPDFRYMLARDAAVPADALAFMSDRFVAAVVGPRQKILEARRQVALAELQRPAFAALLFGWVYGHAPASTDELVASGLLHADELAHAGGGAITFAPGQSARSEWGAPTALEPLVERASPDKVTPSEAEAYRIFARGYENYWRNYMDPVAVRVATDPKGRDRLDVDVRVLPIIDGTDYSELARTVGEARVQAAGARRDAQATLGLGAEAELRRNLRASARDVPLLGRVDVDWLGGWVAVGLDDAMWGGGTLAPDAATVERANAGIEGVVRLLHELPLFASVEVRSSTAAALFFAAARAEVERAAPGVLEWREAGRHRDVPFVKINGGAGARQLARGAEDINLYYTFCKSELVLALSEKTLRRRIDDCLDGRVAAPGPPPRAGGAAAPQATFELDARADGPLTRLLISTMKASAARGELATARLAEVVLRGAPELDPTRARALARATFATDVTTPAGRDFVLADDGVRGVVAGGATTAVVEGAEATPAERATVELLRHFRSDVAFDPEVSGAGVPLTRSLHVRFRLGAR